VIAAPPWRAYLCCCLVQKTAAVLDRETFDTWANQPGVAMVVFADDPDRAKETLDLAVIVPELHAACGRRFRVGLLPPAVARALAARYGFARWPAFVMLRDGRYLGAVDGVRDWGVYLGEVERLMAAEPTRPPTVGIRCRRQSRRLLSLIRRHAAMRPVNIDPQPDAGTAMRSVHADAARMATFEMPRCPSPGNDVAGARRAGRVLAHFDAC
jgi:hydrogenase-1 operon protein HyaE